MTRCNNHAFRAARKRAGLADVDWHALRHTWASWHVQSGTPLPVLQQLGGWATLEMVMVYAHLAPAHLAAYADNAQAPQGHRKGHSERALSRKAK